MHSIDYFHLISGEYIALYHKQRLLLRQRAVEKDEQVIQLSKDREELKGKLASLNELVARLVADHSNNAVEAKGKNIRSIKRLT